MQGLQESICYRLFHQNCSQPDEYNATHFSFITHPLY